MTSIPIGVLAAIPSPSFNTLGPFTLYGLMIGLGIIAATMLLRPRLTARRIHPDMAVEMLMWAVPGGVIGARLYHIATDAKAPSEWLKIWEGGLGIPGAIAGGAIAVLIFIHRQGLPRPATADAIAPVLPLAQAIGRWGNWWNQELFGGPTDLPWGLEIAENHRTFVKDGAIVADYSQHELFHPTFLYESMWNLGLCGVLLWIDRKQMLRPGKLIWVYTGGYALGRLWIEMLRIDPATTIAGIRVNLWLMGIVLLVSVFLLRGADASTGGVTTDANATRPDETSPGAAFSSATGPSASGAPTDDDYDEDLVGSGESDGSGDSDTLSARDTGPDPDQEEEQEEE